MKQWAYQLANNPDHSQGNLVCIIQGLANDLPGQYVDDFTGYDAQTGIAWDRPVTETNVITVVAAH